MILYVMAAVVLYALYRLWPHDEDRTEAISRAPVPEYGCAGYFERNPSPFCVMLDIDGVLHPGFSGSLEFVPDFEAVMRRWPDVDIVVSSDWRIGGSLEYLRSLFSDDIALRIVGGTGEGGGTYPRHDEIVKTCRAYGISRWVALDDSADLFPPECDYLVLLDRHAGLSGDGSKRATMAFSKTFGEAALQPEE